jgi:hypothetical protein
MSLSRTGRDVHRDLLGRAGLVRPGCRSGTVTVDTPETSVFDLPGIVPSADGVLSDEDPIGSGGCYQPDVSPGAALRVDIHTMNTTNGSGGPAPSEWLLHAFGLAPCANGHHDPEP